MKIYSWRFECAKWKKKRQERKKRKKGKFFTSASLGPIIGHKFLAPATREIEWIARTTWFKFWASKRSIVWKRSFLGTPSFSQWRRKLLMFSIFLFGLLFASASFFFFFFSFFFLPYLFEWHGGGVDLDGIGDHLVEKFAKKNTILESLMEWSVWERLLWNSGNPVLCFLFSMRIVFSCLLFVFCIFVFCIFLFLF